MQGSSSKNPLDIMAVLFNENNFQRVIELLRDDTNTDALIFNLNPAWIYKGMGRSKLLLFIESVVQAVNMLQKPLFLSIEQKENPQLAFIREEMVELFNQNGVATFPNFTLTARIINNLIQYHHFRQAC
jgi:acyl-CoA synthetase (NDP forming)